MLAYLARRLAISALLLGCVVFLTFVLHHALPGDPAAAVLGHKFTAQQAEEMRERLGLDDSLPVQFARYVGRLTRGDLGRSRVSNVPVTEELARALPATIELGLLAVLLATVLGMSLGVFTALHPRTWWDVAGLTAALGGVSLPIFWLGFLAIELFGVGGTLSSASGGGFGGLPLSDRFNAGLFPLDRMAGQPWATGFLLIDTLTVGRNPEAFWHCVSHIILPAAVLASVPTAVIARITRAALGEVLLQDYIRTARAKGLTKARIVARHAMRNAAIPVVTSIGTQLGYLMGGAVLTETVFEWPGMGRYAVAAVKNLDIEPLQACVLVVAVAFLTVNLLVDLSYGWIDPRVEVDQ